MKHLNLETVSTHSRSYNPSSLNRMRSVYDHFGAYLFVKVKNFDESRSVFVNQNRALIAVTAFVVLSLGLTGVAEAVTVEALKTPLKDLKTEMFGGWMWGAKVIAGVVGAGFAIAKQSLAPFGIGAGISTAIHVWDKYVGDGSAALI